MNAIAQAEAEAPLSAEAFSRFMAVFEPKTIAIVGVSKSPWKWGYMIPSNIVHGEFKGKIYGVNPKLDELHGFPVYPSLAEIPEPIDLAMIIVPPGGVPDVLRECAACGIGSVVIITAGFGELDDAEAREAQEALTAIGAENNMLVVGPNCAGILSPEPQNLYAAMFARLRLRGPGISIVSQSGNVAGTVMNWARMHRVGISRIVSSGNEAITHTEDFLHFYADDDLTKVIVTYVEGVPNGRRLFDAMRYASQRKPVVMLKGGRNPAGVRATESHTGSLAAPMNLLRAACRQAGVALVEDIFEMGETAAAFLNQPLPPGRRVAIVSGGGGWGVMAADACAEAGLNVVNLPEETIAELDKFLPKWWSRGNPIDMVAGTTDPMAGLKAAEVLMKSPAVDVLLFLGIGYGSQRGRYGKPSEQEKKEGMDKMADAFLEKDLNNAQRLAELRDEFGKPVFAASEMVLDAYGPKPNAGIRELENRGIIASHNLATVARTICHLAERREFLEGVVRKPAPLDGSIGA